MKIRKDDLWPNGLNRVELQHKPEAATEAEGSEGYYGWSLYLLAALSGALREEHPRGPG